ncbi:MAG: hypothetical protein KJ968_01055 [Nanoarchaeota archaeon]|nr:hypothetical protein [Nanoarchaeota archaeon]MBU4283670.1 hypothetical protein [Nanoarchaeota archaeon]
MKKKLREIVDNLEHEDLIKLQKDLEEEGGIHIKKLISDKIQQLEDSEKAVCAVCGNPINPYYTEHYKLIFGPRDFRKKASFCALDCMEYFLKDLKQAKTIKE